MESRKKNNRVKSGEKCPDKNKLCQLFHFHSPFSSSHYSLLVWYLLSISTLVFVLVDLALEHVLLQDLLQVAVLLRALGERGG